MTIEIVLTVCWFQFPFQDAVCAEALDESMCLKNPQCSWCEGRCREYQPINPVKHLFVQPCGCYIYFKVFVTL